MNDLMWGRPRDTGSWASKRNELMQRAREHFRPEDYRHLTDEVRSEAYLENDRRNEAARDGVPSVILEGVL